MNTELPTAATHRRMRPVSAPHERLVQAGLRAAELRTMPDAQAGPLWPAHITQLQSALASRIVISDQGLSARSASQSQPPEPALTTSTVSRWIGFEHAAEE